MTNKKKHKFISKKKNGHKDYCQCPICINMKFAKKGGYGLKDYDDYEKEVKENEVLIDTNTDNIIIAKDEEYDMLGGKYHKKKKTLRNKNKFIKKKTLRKK